MLPISFRNATRKLFTSKYDTMPENKGDQEVTGDENHSEVDNNLLLKDLMHYIKILMTWEPCWSQITKRGTGNLSFIIAFASSWGACNSWANTCRGCRVSVSKLKIILKIQVSNSANVDHSYIAWWGWEIKVNQQLTWGSIWQNYAIHETGNRKIMAQGKMYFLTLFMKKQVYLTSYVTNPHLTFKQPQMQRLCLMDMLARPKYTKIQR